MLFYRCEDRQLNAIYECIVPLAYWTERPNLFSAISATATEEARMLAVLRWFIVRCSLGLRRWAGFNVMFGRVLLKVNIPLEMIPWVQRRSKPSLNLPVLPRVYMA